MSTTSTKTARDVGPAGEKEQDSEVWTVHSLSLTREIAFVSVVSACQLFTQSGLAMSIAPLHIIGDDLGIGGEPAYLSWSPAAYSLTVGTFILIAGRIGDLYGHKKAVIFGWVWFGFWSLIGGFSVYVHPHPDIFFDTMRAIQGIGPAFLLPNGVALLGRAYPPGPRKNLVFSIFGLTAPTGFIVGAVFSSLIAQFGWWPWVYWANCIACLVFAGLSWRVIPDMDEYNPERRERGSLDLPGCATGTMGLILINFAFNQGPVVGWETVYVYVLLIVGFLFMGAFVWVEGRAKYPLVPIQSLTRELLLVMAAIGAGWSSFGIWTFYIWQFWQILRGDSPLKATAQMLPVIFSGAFAALMTAYLISRIRPGFLLLGSMFAFATGNIIAAVTPPSLNYWAASFIAMLIMPIGMDCSFPAGNLVASASMPRHQQGLAASLVNTVLNYSISIGLGIAALVETQVNKDGTQVLKGYRSAFYVGIGLAGMGIGVAATLVWVTRPGAVTAGRQREKVVTEEDLAGSGDSQEIPPRST